MNLMGAKYPLLSALFTFWVCGALAFKQTNFRVDYVDISPNGRYTAFTTRATNWVSFDTNQEDDIVVYDNLNPGVYKVATVNSTGVVVEKNEADDTASIVDVPEFVSVSNGGAVIYTSDSIHLDPPNSGFSEVFVHCPSHSRAPRMTSSKSLSVAVLNTSTTRCISRDSANNFNSDSCTNGGISADGQWATFICYGNFPLLRKIQGGGQVYLKNLITNVTVMVGPSPTNASESISSVLQLGTARNGLSDDGRYVSFSALTTEYGPVGRSGYFDVYVWDRISLTTTLVTKFTDRDTANWGHCEALEMSANGTLIGFTCQDALFRNVYGVWDRTADQFRIWSQTFSNGLYRSPKFSRCMRYFSIVENPQLLISGWNANYTLNPGKSHVVVYDFLAQRVLTPVLPPVGRKFGDSPPRTAEEVGVAISENMRTIAFISNYNAWGRQPDLNFETNDAFNMDTQTGTITRLDPPDCLVANPTACAYSEFQSAGPDPLLFNGGADERHAITLSQTGSVAVYAASYENIDTDLPRPQYGWDLTQPHVYVRNGTAGTVKMLRANATAGFNRNEWPIRSMSLTENGDYLLWKTTASNINTSIPAGGHVLTHLPSGTHRMLSFFAAGCYLAMNDDASAIASACPDGTVSVTTGVLSGTPSTTLLSNDFAQVIFISRDAQKVAFLAGSVYLYDRTISQRVPVSSSLSVNNLLGMSADGNRILFDATGSATFSAGTGAYDWGSNNAPIIYDYAGGGTGTLRKLPTVFESGVSSGAVSGHPKLSRDGSRVIATLNPPSSIRPDRIDRRRSFAYHFDVNTFPATWEALAAGNNGHNRGVAISGDATVLGFFSSASNIALGSGRVDANFGPDLIFYNRTSGLYELGSVQAAFNLPLAPVAAPASVQPPAAVPAAAPVQSPIAVPVATPTQTPTAIPVAAPTVAPIEAPAATPTSIPTSAVPAAEPLVSPIEPPFVSPTAVPPLGLAESPVVGSCIGSSPELTFSCVDNVWELNCVGGRCTATLNGFILNPQQTARIIGAATVAAGTEIVTVNGSFTIDCGSTLTVAKGVKFRILGDLRICGRLIVTQLDPRVGSPPIFEVTGNANFTSGQIRLNGTSIPLSTTNVTISIATFGGNPGGTRLTEITIDQEPQLDCRTFETTPRYDAVSLSVAMGILETQCTSQGAAFNNVVAVAVPIAIVAVVLVAVAIAFAYWYRKKVRYEKEAKLVRNKIAASRGQSASNAPPPADSNKTK